MLRVILIRHAQTSWNQSRRIQGGGHDTILNEEGERQCRCLIERFKKEEVRGVYSSPLSRALATATAIAQCYGLKVTVEEAFREIDCGTMAGTPIGEIGSRLQQLVKGGDESELLFKSCGGEALEELQKRAWDAVLRIAEKHQDGTVIVVSHYFVIAAIISAVLGLPATQLGRFRIGETSVSAINFDSYGPFLSLFNDRCHLINT
ncbi:MAG: histidine phosphatase family protein [Chloroflexota bacterium]